MKNGALCWFFAGLEENQGIIFTNLNLTKTVGRAFKMHTQGTLKRAYFCPTKIRKHLHRPYTPEN